MSIRETTPTETRDGGQRVLRKGWADEMLAHGAPASREHGPAIAATVRRRRAANSTIRPTTDPDAPKGVRRATRLTLPGRDAE